MPIYSIAERSFANIRTIGRLHKGEPKPERGPGKDLDCFRFTSEDPAVMAAFKAAYGSDRVKELHVYLPYAREALNWDYWFETWGGKRIRYRCDGQNWVKWLTEDGKAYSRELRPCPICAGEVRAKQGEHKPTGRLRLVLPELLAAGFAGTVLLATTAYSDIYSINSAFLDVAERRTDGRGELTGIEFILRRDPREVFSREHGSQRRHVVVLEPVAEWIQQQLGRAHTPAAFDPSTGEILDGDEEPPEDVGDDNPFELDDDGLEGPEPDSPGEDEAELSDTELETSTVLDKPAPDPRPLTQADIEELERYRREEILLPAKAAMAALKVARYSDYVGDVATVKRLWQQAKRGNGKAA